MTLVESKRLEALRDEWARQWPAALWIWSPYVKLHPPCWCMTPEEETRERLTGSFAMIRLDDHSVVISLRQIEEQGLQRFAKEILAHEIGHHVYCPADLTDNARLLARIRAGLPTKEHLAPFISNLYSDLLINDRLQRTAELDIAGVYRKLDSGCGEKIWLLYLRIYELLWRLPRGQLAVGEFDAELNQNAVLGARLIRSYSKDWLDGGGRFAALCLTYLIEDGAERTRLMVTPWLDTQAAGCGALPDGLVEIDENEASGAIHPSEDSELSGIVPSDGEKTVENKCCGGEGLDAATGVKPVKGYRQPFEYTAVMQAAAANLDPRTIVANYYRERALPHLISFPVRQQPEATDPIPEGLDVWDIGSPIEEVDWLGTLVASPLVIPGITTRQRLRGDSPGTNRESLPVDLYLGVDCSGSMDNPGHQLSFPVLAGAIIALSALRTGARAKVVLSGEPGQTVSTNGFVRDQTAVLGTLTSYLGTGTSFGIHRLDETFSSWPASVRPVHILIVSDNDMFPMLDSRGNGRNGWEVARNALLKAGGGGTFVLELMDYVRAPEWKQDCDKYIERMKRDGWNVYIVSSMAELVEFARQFVRDNYTSTVRKS